MSLFCSAPSHLRALKEHIVSSVEETTWAVSALAARGGSGKSLSALPPYSRPPAPF